MKMISSLQSISALLLASALVAAASAGSTSYLPPAVATSGSSYVSKSSYATSGGYYAPGGGSITAVEDAFLPGFMVATGPYSFAILLCHKSNPYKWTSVTINSNGQAYVVYQNNTLWSGAYSYLSPKQLEFVFETRAHLAQDLGFPALAPPPSYNGPSSYPVNSAHGGGKRGYGKSGARGLYHFGGAHSKYPSVSYAQPPPPAKVQALYNSYNSAYQEGATVNYINLAAYPLLNDSLNGDVYNFDLATSAIVDVYSANVTFHQTKGGRSILYRDLDFFAYSRPQMPFNINRFFLIGDSIIFVYRDSSLLAKPVKLVSNPIELALLAEARLEVNKLLQIWPYAGSPRQSYYSSSSNSYYANSYYQPSFSNDYEDDDDIYHDDDDDDNKGDNNHDKGDKPGKGGPAPPVGVGAGVGSGSNSGAGVTVGAGSSGSGSSSGSGGGVSVSLGGN